ncbi:chemotaxis protein CheW [Catenovulum maritimum]|uniref:Chemotaxis protein CheW n=1 Tax=Catenovulum maritimum TaxID=1513271 RepID=A0A0J8GNJ9_9ALTE|nr:chemotaxis protein CheW [Catenovulum maritimum]KMT64400.1 chemotaxis protein CheW [Catenovulum maritimum]
MNIEQLNAQLGELETELQPENMSQYLTFFMDNEEYGIDILKVQEIRGWESTTAIPNSAEYIKGVINLRGTIVPVIDLRLKFSIENVQYTAVTVVIVLKLTQEGKEKIMGVVVDAVSDVHSISDSQIKVSPGLGDNNNSKFIKGLGVVGDKTLILLELNDVL